MCKCKRFAQANFAAPPTAGGGIERNVPAHKDLQQEILPTGGIVNPPADLGHTARRASAHRRDFGVDGALADDYHAGVEVLGVIVE
jgi:hypothetical protein